MAKVRTWRPLTRLVVAGGAFALAPGPAAAQSSPVSELWREWAVLVADWRAERALHPRDRARHQALRAGAPATAPAPLPATTGEPATP